MSGEETEGHTEAVGTGPDLAEFCLGWRGGVWPGRPAHTARVLDSCLGAEGYIAAVSIWSLGPSHLLWSLYALRSKA